ncbi:MAG: hypothetical protein RBR69_01450 [Candidatus Cloacimonadaceae bacterium]|jgi:hypothetical protein|nr:hypothetical protein [Candidatus Cloacimonadota bacterium]MDY0126791.1 hypothetical protein [Candidatus Cloacimonadaceae bacterium]MCB5254227.1 hypothetical protein [Candidatus Cloacimonadota bacterium]MCK9177508.1 hypothetical protein [Candidatus Cloacimonadota bacterium]MCK9243562.1 hypothetical protein [Candidatus Cloacimonadota bacterium]
MTSKKTKIIKELDPQDVKGFSQARIDHYLSLGYRPYLDEKSRIKWLTQAQRNMRGAKSIRVPIMHRIFPKKVKSRYRKKRHKRNFGVFIQDNWFFIFTVFLVAIFVILVLLKPDLIF